VLRRNHAPPRCGTRIFWARAIRFSTGLLPVLVAEMAALNPELNAPRR